jgi:hypothetical protein
MLECQPEPFDPWPGKIDRLAAGFVCAWASATQEAGGSGACDPAVPMATTTATPRHRAVDCQRREPRFVSPVSRLLLGSAEMTGTGPSRSGPREGPRRHIAGYLKVNRWTPSWYMWLIWVLSNTDTPK